jgi:hypothetical protein
MDELPVDKALREHRRNACRLHACWETGVPTTMISSVSTGRPNGSLAPIEAEGWIAADRAPDQAVSA